MPNPVRRFLVAALAALATAMAGSLAAQRQAGLTPHQAAQRWRAERELQEVAEVERKVMMPMRDGVRLATDVYRPRNGGAKVPTIFVRTPYNFNHWDVQNGVPRDMTQVLAAVKRGYAYVIQNERGHFFSEGHYDILGAPTTDGYDALDWIAPGFEVVQSHLPDWKFKAADTVADGGLHARLIVGRKIPVAEIAASASELTQRLASARVSLRRNGALVEEGAGANVLDSPFHALHHFLVALRQCPGAPELMAGDVVTTGTWTDAWPLQAGDHWTADFSSPLSSLALAVL